MYGHHDIRSHVADGGNDPDAATANEVVELVVDEGGDCVPNKGSEEDEGYDGEVDVVVCFELWGG